MKNTAWLLVSVAFGAGCETVPTMQVWVSSLSSVEELTIPTAPGLTQHRFVLGDIDGDGRADLVDRALALDPIEGSITHHANARCKIHVFHSTGLGFEDAGNWYYAPKVDVLDDIDPNCQSPMTITDVNGDGRGDLLVHYTGLLGLSDGLGLQPMVETPMSFDFVGDVNGDGFPDLSGAQYNDGAYNQAVSLNLGGAGFALPQAWSPWFLETFLGDINGDGLADAVSADSALIMVYPSDGTAFGAGQIWLPGPEEALGYNIGFADVTGDGQLDAINRWGSGGVEVYPNLGDQFGTGTLWAALNPPAEDSNDNDFGDLATVPDLNSPTIPLSVGDGRADVLDEYGSPFRVLASNGAAFVEAGRFAPPTPEPACPLNMHWYDYASPCYTVEFGDVTGDGQDDVVYQAEDSVWVYSVPTSTPGASLSVASAEAR